MITRCPILTKDCDYDLSWDELEAQGPFVPAFLTDLKKVWAILHVLFSTSSMDGCQVYHTLHAHFFGADKVNTMVNDILLSLKSKVY